MSDEKPDVVTIFKMLGIDVTVRRYLGGESGS